LQLLPRQLLLPWADQQTQTALAPIFAHSRSQSATTCHTRRRLLSGQPPVRVIRVRLSQTITSETARVGDQFSTIVVDPVYVGGVEVITGRQHCRRPCPNCGTRREKEQSRNNWSAVVSVRLPSGITRAINGDLTEANSENVNADNEVSSQAGRQQNGNVVFIVAAQQPVH